MAQNHIMPWWFHEGKRERKGKERKYEKSKEKKVYRVQGIESKQRKKEEWERRKKKQKEVYKSK